MHKWFCRASEQHLTKKVSSSVARQLPQCWLKQSKNQNVICNCCALGKCNEIDFFVTCLPIPSLLWSCRGKAELMFSITVVAINMSWWDCGHDCSALFGLKPGVHPGQVISPSQGHILTKSNISPHSFPVGNLETSYPNMHVFGLWEETGGPEENSGRQREKMQTPHKGLSWDTNQESVLLDGG